MWYECAFNLQNEWVFITPIAHFTHRCNITALWRTRDFIPCRVESVVTVNWCECLYGGGSILGSCGLWDNCWLHLHLFQLHTWIFQVVVLIILWLLDIYSCGSYYRCLLYYITFKFWRCWFSSHCLHLNDNGIAFTLWLFERENEGRKSILKFELKRKRKKEEFELLFLTVNFYPFFPFYIYS